MEEPPPLHALLRATERIPHLASTAAHNVVVSGARFTGEAMIRLGSERWQRRGCKVTDAGEPVRLVVHNSFPLALPVGKRRTQRQRRQQQLLHESQSATTRGIQFVAATSTVPVTPRITSIPQQTAQTTVKAPPKKTSGGGGGRRKFEGLPDDPPITRHPTIEQLLTRPVAFFRYMPKDVGLFIAGALSGAAAKSITAPLDRVKLMMQVQSVQDATSRKAIGMASALTKIFREEGVKGLWKGNLPQVIRVVPYSAVQLFAYETYKKLFQGTSDDLSVGSRLAAGACAGMTSTLVTYPLDTLRLRLAVDPLSKSMSQVFWVMLREEGLSSFYRGLGPSLLGIAPYIALNFCVFDLMKKSVPEEYRSRPEASFLTALCSATFATVMCYPLDTVRRQMQMRGSPFRTVFDAFPGIVARDGVGGLYRGFMANALKNLPNSSIRLTIYDGAKNLIIKSRKEFDTLLEDRTVPSS